MSGKLIVVEGVDGSGKTTVSKLLAERLTALGLSVWWTCEPFPDSPAYQYIRDMLGGRIPMNHWALALAFALNRADHVAKIRLMIQNGYTVVCDRYLSSSMVYQVGDEVSASAVELINWSALEPDMTLILDVNEKAWRERMTVRGGESEVFEKTFYGNAYRWEMMRLVRNLWAVELVDANDDVETVVERCIGKLDGVL